METEISHREIYDRLVAVESKVDAIQSSTSDVVAAFNAAQGAFKVLEFFAKIAKPLMVIIAAIGAVGVTWQHWRGN